MADTLAIALGAAGAHVLAGRPPALQRWFDIALEYQRFHALGLLLIGLLLRSMATRWLVGAGLLMLALLGDLLLLPALLLTPAGKLFEPGAEFPADKPKNRRKETEPESVGEWQTQMARVNDAEWAER